MDPVVASTVAVGQHWTGTIFGQTLNLDTIVSTLVASAVVLAVGFWLRHVVTDGVPGKLQTTLETVFSTIDDYVAQMVGSFARWMVPLVTTLFFFILISNWLELIPTGDRLTSPTADTNLTFGLAFLVIILVHVTSIRRLGIGGYFKVNYAHPAGLPKPLYLLLAPINVIAQISYPVSLSLRLFGNMFAAALMLQIIALLPIYLGWVLNGIWKIFEGVFVDVIQAFIFALLTVIYMSMATSHEAEEVSGASAGALDAPAVA
ncbi:MAG TPA: F0F1 ATP synthase subunit A [Verrucomicrobiae bacterium]|nr:F0F1 ATP synthase subunit A [Verrucomicrobiae bacterium]